MRQKLFSRALPEPPAQAPTRKTLLDQAQNLPFFAPVRLYFETLEQVRPWWPVLLPLLAWVAWRAYQEERTKLARRSPAT